MKQKEVDKAVTAKLKEITLAKEFRKRDYALFKKQGEYFLCISVFGLLSSKESGQIAVWGGVKPLWIDEVFWNVMRMPENSKAPLSLRAVGVFTAPELEVFNQKAEVNSLEDVDGIIDLLFEECKAKMQSALEDVSEVYDDFLKLAINYNAVNHIELYEILTEIQKNNFVKAKSITQKAISKGRKGYYANDCKFIYKEIIDYCDANI